MAFQKLYHHAVSNIQKIKIIRQGIIICLLIACFINAGAQPDTVLKNTLPPAGKFINNQPSGKGWINLLAAPDSWNAEEKYWQWSNGILHGEANGETMHHYAWTKKAYNDFELNVMIKMTGGEDANSGVCIRLHPTNFC